MRTAGIEDKVVVHDNGYEVVCKAGTAEEVTV